MAEKDFTTPVSTRNEVGPLVRQAKAICDAFACADPQDLMDGTVQFTMLACVDILSKADAIIEGRNHA